MIKRLAAQAGLVENPDGTRSVIVHETAVATQDETGAVTLDTGGWNTPTTRKNMNRALDTFGRGDWRVYTSRGLFCAWHWETEAEFAFAYGRTLTIDDRLTKLAALAAQATESAKSRRHDLEPWTCNGKDGAQPTRATTECKRCKLTASVTLDPAPNDIDISGEAIALQCRGAPYIVERRTAAGKERATLSFRTPGLASNEGQRWACESQGNSAVVRKANGEMMISYWTDKAHKGPGYGLQYIRY